MGNTGYKAADKEGRKAIAGCRKALDLMIATHRGVPGILYTEAPELAVKASRANIVVSDKDRLNGMGN